MIKESDLFEVLDCLEVANPQSSASAHYETYDALLEKIKSTCKTDALDFEWEEETDDEMDNEDVLGFRKTVEPGVVELSLKSNDTSTGPDDAYTSKITTRHLEVNSDQIFGNNEFQTTTQLEDSFHKELTEATIKADFDERYIQSTLERRRLGLPREEPVSTWKQSIQANPLTTLENISRSVLERAPSLEFDVGTIKELEENSTNIEIAPSSQKFSHFLPLDAPILDLIQFDL